MQSKQWAVRIVLGGVCVAALAVLGLVCSGQEEPSEPVAPEPGPAAPVGAQPSEASDQQGRVVILGFDGVEPKIVNAMLEAGELPNLAKVRDAGMYSELESTIPPQSPSAWSSFITSKSTGQHGIYDFLRRIPSVRIGGEMRTIPAVGYTSRSHARISPTGGLLQPPSIENARVGLPFWVYADRAGKRSRVLHVPFAFPADNLQHGYMLCGLGIPDIRNTDSTFFSFSERYTEQKSVSGGIQFPLAFTDGEAEVSIPGARDSRQSSSDPGGYTSTPLTFTIDREAKTMNIGLPEGTIELVEGSWSPWVEWDFAISDEYHVRAISRFHCISTAEPATVYMSCLQFHPDAPYVPISHPESYAADLKERYGLYKTVGWIFDTHALRQDALPEDIFLADVAATMEWRETLVLDELDRGEYDLVVGAWTGPDRVSHLFWRFRDPGHPLYTEEGAAKYGEVVEDTYRRMDETVGKVAERLNEDDLLMILSDHGFHSFRKGLNVNTWLIRNGYQAAVGQTDAATAFNDGEFLDGIDWANTKAYSLGLGSIFLNLEGREANGIVPEADAASVIEEIAAKLAEVVDPDTGDKVFSAIYTIEDFGANPSGDAPDIQLGYAEGYQSTKDTVKGSAPVALFEPTTDKWSGEHASSDFKQTPGILFANKAMDSENPRIIDLGATALDYLGIATPRDFEGASLLPE